MRASFSITDILVPEVGKPLVEELARVYPEGSDGYSFRAVLATDDPRIPLLIAILNKAGLRQEPTGKWNAYKPGKQFSVFKTVTYEPSDYESARFISGKLRGFTPRFDEENADTLDPSVRLLSLEEPTGKKAFAGTNFGRLIATLLGRRLLEESAFEGISYIPAYFVDERSDVRELRDLIAKGGNPDLGEPPLWEVRPTVMLPSMLPLVYTHVVNGEQRISRNPIDVDCRMAYSKTDLDNASPFDIARPHPSEDPQKALVDPLVVSQRFFQFMKKQKNFDLKQWTPVREE